MNSIGLIRDPWGTPTGIVICVGLVYNNLKLTLEQVLIQRDGLSRLRSCSVLVCGRDHRNPFLYQRRLNQLSGVCWNHQLHAQPPSADGVPWRVWVLKPKHSGFRVFCTFMCSLIRLNMTFSKTSLIMFNKLIGLYDSGLYLSFLGLGKTNILASLQAVGKCCAQKIDRSYPTPPIFVLNCLDLYSGKK